jgi:hypothetical protein
MINIFEPTPSRDTGRIFVDVLIDCWGPWKREANEFAPPDPARRERATHYQQDLRALVIRTGTHGCVDIALEIILPGAQVDHESNPITGDRSRGSSHATHGIRPNRGHANGVGFAPECL